MSCDINISPFKDTDSVAYGRYYNGSDLIKCAFYEDKDGFISGIDYAYEYFFSEFSDTKTSKEFIHNFRDHSEFEFMCLRNIKKSLSKNIKGESKEFCLAKNGLTFKITVQYLGETYDYGYNEFNAIFARKNEVYKDPDKKKGYDFFMMIIFKYIKEYNEIGKEILSKCKKVEN